MNPQQPGPVQLALAFETGPPARCELRAKPRADLEDSSLMVRRRIDQEGMAVRGKTGPDYGRPDDRLLTEALQDGWRTAAVLNDQAPGDGEWVPIRAIQVREAILPRMQLDTDAVERYALAFDQLPPITVQKDTFVLIDGRHRLAAAPQAVRDHIRIREMDIPDEDLADWAVQANVTHGVPLTQAERMHAAKGLLKRHHPQSGGDRAWSVAKIAQWAGVSRSTVHNWLTQESRRGEAAASQHAREGVQVGHVEGAPPPLTRTGRDGKRRRVPATQSRPVRPAAVRTDVLGSRASVSGVTEWSEQLDSLLASNPSEVAATVPDELLEAQAAAARAARGWFDAYVRALTARQSDSDSATA